MAARLSALRAGRRFRPQKHHLPASGTHFFYRLSKPQGSVRTEGLRQLIEVIHLIGSRNCDILACSIVPVHLTSDCYSAGNECYLLGYSAA
jgi:hypothetical protein